MSFATLPPWTDFIALMGIDLVLCAWGLRLMQALSIRPWVRASLLVCLLALLWIPAGTAQIPLLSYVRGISSDLSMTLVTLACLCLWRGFGGACFGKNFPRETRSVFLSVAVAAVFLYPMALGWGNWDAYRPGWGSIAMLACVLITGLLALAIGLRLLPMLLALAVLAWTANLLESANLWDYLFDPWLAVASIYQALKIFFVALNNRFNRHRVQMSSVHRG